MKIELNDKVFDLEIERKRMRSIRVRMKSDSSIHVSCPRHVTSAQVNDFIMKNTDWILKQSEHEKDKQNLCSAGEDGKSVMWKGKMYPIVRVHSNQKIFEKQADAFIISDRFQSPDEIKNAFYTYASKEMADMLQKYRKRWDAEICDVNQIYCPRIAIRYMTSRWGSCTPGKHTIRMSVRLMHFPEECMNYVLLHEYAHLLVANHSAAFHAIVTEHMPEWKRYDRMLSGKA